ncbi:hypothetical protein KY290_008432 [Solanum tuberosum]|uniref:Uncharacterized protein n=1 Tax=Solanum tuberosum TaxID=4113 RepID=A0ABQ7W8C8_SOLTU|nr:hypothetical protein KY289_008843 [Solanum tuberosum]KAH0777021.1 hypothetical protein KY290_008432 [Solanum tuberosum]
MVDDGGKIGDLFDSTKKENQKVLSCDKQDEYQYQDSIKKFRSLSMVDDEDKRDDLFVESEKLGLSGHEKLKRHSIKKFRSLSMVDDEDKRDDLFVESEKLGLSGREKLKRHWREVGGRVCVPDRWGHEGSLREWMDCSSFDNNLAPKGLKSAREALMSQGKRACSTSRMLEIRSR